MSKTRRWKLLSAVLAAVLCLTVCAFSVFADTLTTGAEASEEEPVVTTGAEPTATTGEAQESGTEDTATTGEAQESEAAATTGEAQESEAGTTGETQESAPAESKPAESAAESATEESEPAQSTASNVPWKLIISLGVIILIVAVLFILAKTKTKLGEKISKFFKDYKSELKKIVWMPWKDLLKATGIVLVVLLVAAAIIGLLDYGFSSLILLLSKIGS
ncbi:MAG: preprotein translocase subunit SecE [Clostridia bacterium]|nr:preprotein translocase subunit SecE [Clostridia bacterium]